MPEPPPQDVTPPGRVVLLVPALDEVEHMPRVGAFARACREAGLVARSVVLDGGSSDGTVAAARAAGLEVWQAHDATADEPLLGKGDAVWRASAELEADAFVLVDADVEGLTTDSVAALVGGLADGAVLVKGSFERLQSHDGRVRPIGGRITEFLVKPLLRQLVPELAHLREPLSGQFAVRAEALRGLPVATGYGLEIALLLEVVRHHGRDAVREVPLGRITHREKADAELVSMADDIAATMRDRLPLVVDGRTRPVPASRRLTPRITVRPAHEPLGAATPSWLPADRLSVMGIVNVNPNSFSDARAQLDLDERAAFCRQLVADGADVLDLGAQSARTDLPPEDPADEVAWLTSLLAALDEEAPGRALATSIDTYKAEVAAACLDAGATIVNDYSGLVEPDVAGLVADSQAWYVLTHNRGRPKERLTDPGRYDDVMADIEAFFTERLTACAAQGLSADRVILDPGIDLSKTPAQSVEVLRRLPELRAAFGLPHLVAVSRKDFLGAFLGRAPRERDPGMLATLPFLDGLDRTVVRVHDVRGVRDHLAVRDLLRGRRDLDAADQLERDLFHEPPRP